MTANMSFPWKSFFSKAFPSQTALFSDGGELAAWHSPPASPEFPGQRSKLWSSHLFTHLWLSQPEGLFQPTPRQRFQPDVKLMGRSQASETPPAPRGKGSGSSVPCSPHASCFHRPAQPLCPPCQRGERRQGGDEGTHHLPPRPGRVPSASRCSAGGEGSPEGGRARSETSHPNELILLVCECIENSLSK